MDDFAREDKDVRPLGKDADDFWRDQTSTEGKPPRVMIRVFTPPGTLEERISFYEDLQGVDADVWFPFPDARLRLAMVGAFLIIEGDDEALAPFRSTTGTLLVDDVQPYYDKLVAAGAEIIFPLQQVPTGAGFNAVHPDGTVVEYVHHRPTPDGR
ncbi:putative glyoxalase superfamily protein PhnB [Microbacterium resistens]|uniref:Glyoxalase superfamily protein PhnB n=1 Tax=Microbacterium resistens TaxID=156977 RepID=A0ABU1S926_9MICO|nr:hypothetical protein [Microbacterium resistens]MDR6866112.1 putative glyoxalase superfamily protein PhnB [Microbacterium resistens]